MSCPLCDDICRCSIDANSADAKSVPSPRWLPDSASVPAAQTMPADAESSTLEIPKASSAPELSAPELSAPESNVSDHTGESVPKDSSAWRQELSARLNRYQARHKPRPPRYPSLRLNFEAQASARHKAFPTESLGFASSPQALPADRFSGSAARAVEIPESEPPASTDPPPTKQPAADTGAELLRSTLPASYTPGQTTAKIIEFPRSWTPPAPPLDELAEPVMHRPRILEAPEIVPPPPALGGITIDPIRQPEMEKRPGIDIPLQSAGLGRRIFSAAVDDVIIAAACALFGCIFWKLTAIRPPRIQLAGFTAGLTVLFWAAYQYLLVVYSGTTPGLRLARLQLARFDGTPAPRRLRRWRVLASFLSAVSLGMGYAWVFLDEDALCWHDRITHTYLSPTTSVSRR